MHFNSVILKVLMFTLAISYLTTSNLPWFMDLTSQVPMQNCSLECQTLLSPTDIPKTGHCFLFSSASSALVVEAYLDCYDVEWFALQINRDNSVIFEITPKYCILDCFVDYEDYSIPSKGFLSTVDAMSSELNLPVPIHFSSLIPKMSMFTLAISCLTSSNLLWFTDVTFQVSMQYCSFQHQTVLSPPDTSASFPLWPSRFVLSGAVSNCPHSSPAP